MAENKNKAVAQRIVRFGITGCVATAIHICVAYAWMQLESPSSSIANAAAYAVATVFTYLTHTLWSFSSQLEAQSLLKFSVVTLAGLAVSAGVAAYVDWLDYPYGYGIALVVVVIPPFNFLVHHFWTYRVRP
jgi:putative flippase GtrA